jgi:hypothetical protein
MSHEIDILSPIYLPTKTSAYLSIHLFICYLSVYLPVAISKVMQAADQISAGGPYPLPTRTCIYLSIHLSIYLLSIYLSIYLSPSRRPCRQLTRCPLAVRIRCPLGPLPIYLLSVYLPIYLPVAISKAMHAADQMSAGGPYPLPTRTSRDRY